MLRLEEVKKIKEEIEGGKFNISELNNKVCLYCNSHIMPNCIGETVEGEQVCPVCGKKYVVPYKYYSSFSEEDKLDIRFYINLEDNGDDLYQSYLIFKYFYTNEEKYPEFLEIVRDLEKRGNYDFFRESMSRAFLNEDYRRVRELYDIAMEKGLIEVYDYSIEIYNSKVLDDNELFSFLSLASANDDFAYSKLLECYVDGIGVKKNPLIAFRLAKAEISRIYLDCFSETDYNNSMYRSLLTIVESAILASSRLIDEDKKEFNKELDYYSAIRSYLTLKLGIIKDDKTTNRGRIKIDFDSLHHLVDLYGSHIRGRASNFSLDIKNKILSFIIKLNEKLLIANGRDNTCRLTDSVKLTIHYKKIDFEKDFAFDVFFFDKITILDNHFFFENAENIVLVGDALEE